MDDSIIHTGFIVDDSEQDVFLTGRLVKSGKINLQIRHYTSREAILEALLDSDNELVDGSIIFIDRYLGSDNGIDLVQFLRQQEPYKHLLSNIIIGICSGSDNNADVERADSVGASFFVQKPLDVKALRRICEVVPGLEMTETGEGQVTLRRT